MIVIVDYQMGNLRSVQKAFERLGFAAEVSGDPQRVAEAEKVVLPGVGAFGDAMNELRSRGLIPAIEQTIRSGTPFLGICLGLQLLFDVSYEDGEHRGLGILPGKVVRFDVAPPLKVPHMGWNQVQVRQRMPLVEDLPVGAHFYFVHSYYVVPDDPQLTVLESDFDRPFCAMIGREQLYATQFHPEKSQQQGLHLLQKFAEL